MDAPLRLPVLPDRVPMEEAATQPKREPRRLPLVDQLLREQRELTAVERFSQFHERADGHLQEPYYRALLPTTKPKPGQQFAFEVNLDVCSGCKACVAACHRLNGLEEEETWRSVGLLHGKLDAGPVQKTVTSACHHCADPACMKGCPVKAYEKDPETGIVKHLDDQCIGCQYCIFTCPYEVPQFSPKKGIVRKCDMCADRLAEGEAPACVQACPTQAIAIRVVDVADARRDAANSAFLPGAPSPKITTPTTRYVSASPLPSALIPADARAVRPFDSHNPLAIMLVLTQLSAGAYLGLRLTLPALGSAVAPMFEGLQATVAIALTLLALAASTSHLGRPQYAFRAILGIRTSWMSREVLTFGLLAGLGVTYALLVNHAALPLGTALIPAQLVSLTPFVGAALVPVSLGAVFTSVMIYAVTRRAFWALRDTALKFFGTAMILGAATTLACLTLSAAQLAGSGAAEALSIAHNVALALPVLVLAKLAVEYRVFRHRDAEPPTDLSRSVMLLDGVLRPLVKARFVSALAGGVALPLLFFIGAPAALPSAIVGGTILGLLAVAELCERALYFRAMASMRMPGGVV
jgi:Fe-S-cluster-containing dehydrogenase component/DMSO reductase anchor subunit